MPVSYSSALSNSNRPKKNKSSNIRLLAILAVVAVITLIVIVCIRNSASGDVAEVQENAPAEVPQNTSNDAPSAPAAPVAPSAPAAPAAPSAPAAPAVPSAPVATPAPGSGDFGSDEWKKEFVIYSVRSGDGQERVARKHHTTMEMIQIRNDLKPGQGLRLDQKLKLIPGPWKVVISRQANSLTVFQKEKIYAKYNIALPANAANGEFYIVARKAAAIHIRSKNRRTPGYFFHAGNISGAATSYRPIKMRDGDIKLLYYLLPVRTPVVVTD